MSSNNSTISTNTDIKDIGETYSWGQLYKPLNPPETLIDKITRETQLTTNEQYSEIYYLIQDDHISYHRKFYNKWSKDMFNFTSWNLLPIPCIDRFYMLVLKERFEPDRHISTTLNIWYKAFKDYAEKHIGICNVCGMYKLGPCTDKPWEEAILLQFEY